MSNTDSRLARLEQQNDDMAADMKELKTAMKGIETALLGDSFGNFGYGKRLENVEKKVSAHEKFKTRVIGWATGAAGVSTAVINWVIELFK